MRTKIIFCALFDLGVILIGSGVLGLLPPLSVETGALVLCVLFGVFLPIQKPFKKEFIWCACLVMAGIAHCAILDMIRRTPYFEQSILLSASPDRSKFYLLMAAIYAAGECACKLIRKGGVLK